MRFPLIFAAFLLLNQAPVYSSDDARIVVNSDIELVRLDENFYIHTTWFEFPTFGRAPSNGLIFVKNNKALLIDTPNTNEQTATLYQFLHDSLHAEIITVIVGHSHSDCMGGLEFLHKQGVESISGELTRQICISENLPAPKKSFSDSLFFDFEGEGIECRYFGGGHSIDNIVVFFPDSQILFGGCLIKNINSTGLGNTAEAIISEWDETVMNIKKAYPLIRIVIPGHGQFGDSGLLDHTIDLVQRHQN